MLVDLTSQNYNRFRQIKRKNVKIVMTFANAVNKTRYNKTHRIMKLTSKSMIYLRLHQNYIISNLFNKKLFNQRIDSFKILKTISNNQTYRLKLSSIIKIHLVVFIAQLKSITFSLLNSDSYDKRTTDPSSVINEYVNIDAPFYEIERLLNKRIIKGKPYYLIK